MRKHLTGISTMKAVVFAAAFGLAVSATVADKPLTKAELKSLISTAKTRADHQRIAQYFEAEAARYEMEANDHGELAPIYKRKPDPARLTRDASSRAFEHCEALSRDLQRVAEEARNLAAEHRTMAHEAQK